MPLICLTLILFPDSLIVAVVPKPPARHLRDGDDDDDEELVSVQ